MDNTADAEIFSRRFVVFLSDLFDDCGISSVCLCLKVVSLL